MNKELFVKVREWAAARNIIKGATPVSQFAKLISEHGELAGHILDYQAIGYHPSMNEKEIESVISLQDKMIDDIGDAIVVLTIIGAQLGVNIEDIGPDSIEGGSEYLSLNVAFGMLADAILKVDLESFKSLVSTIFALYSKLATDLNTDISNCLAAAYEDIKDRKGVMYNGTFVKSTDARYKDILTELGLSE